MPLKAKPADQLTGDDRAQLKRGEEAEERQAKRQADRRKFAVSSGNRNRTVSMIAQALPHRTVEPAAMDADPMLFNLANGTLRFRRQVVEVPDPECPDPDARRTVRQVKVGVELVPHNRGHRLAKLVPHGFDPKARCPRFFKFLKRIKPSREERRYLMTALGRALLGGASTQILLFWYGDGANGKSVLQETIAQLLSDYAGRLKPEALSGNTEVGSDRATPEFARLAGKRLLVIEELPRGAPLKEALIKTVTGGTPMPVRHLNKGLFDLVPEFLPVMTGNEMPEIGGLDHGIWRRMKFIAFDVKIPPEEQRPLNEVVAEFLEEAPGILNWLIAGACRFLREGLREPESVTRLTTSHREDLDPVGAFVTACVRPCPSGSVQARDMFNAFVAFAEANAIRPWKETGFGRAMKKKGFVRDDKRIRRWLDVELVDVPAKPEPRSPHQEDFPP
jgi:putative DNA primase/helicase